VIKDGTGAGFGVKVDDHNRLYTLANVVSHMSHHATYHKNGFVKSFSTTLPDTSETVVASLENNSASSDYELYWVRVSSESAVEVNIYKGGSRSGGGTLLELENTNFGGSSIADDISYEGGASGDLAVSGDAALIDGCFLAAGGTKEFEYFGGIVLPRTTSFVIKVIGAATDKVKVTLGFALHAADTKL